MGSTGLRQTDLKKSARFVHWGRLTSIRGPAAHKEVSNRAEYQRAIIHCNPPNRRGWLWIGSDEEVGNIHMSVASAMEENPYTSIGLDLDLRFTSSVLRIEGNVGRFSTI
ncbi:hypothetical protein VTI28DRAFT_5883 [Corynascus sepedonium]